MITDAKDFIKGEQKRVKKEILHKEQQDKEHGLACSQGEREILTRWLISLRTIELKMYS